MTLYYIDLLLACQNILLRNSIRFLRVIFIFSHLPVHCCGSFSTHYYFQQKAMQKWKKQIWKRICCGCVLCREPPAVLCRCERQTAGKLCSLILPTGHVWKRLQAVFKHELRRIFAQFACSESCGGSTTVFSHGLIRAISRVLTKGYICSPMQLLRRMSGDNPELNACQKAG